MKSILLSIILAFFAFGSFASNKICVGETVIVVFNQNLKKLVVHDRETLEILQSTELEGYSFGEIALSKDETKVWFQMDGKMYCRDMKTGEIAKEIQGSNAYKFELSAAQDYLIHYETIEESTLIYVYDLNTAEAVAYAKVDFTTFVETCHYDHEKQELHLLSRTFVSKTEKRPKEPMFGFPETAEEIALGMRHDEKESRYYIYDIANKAVIYDENIFYSSGFSVDFEVINDTCLYLVTQVGTAEVLDDHSLRITSFVATNLADYAILGNDLVGVNGFVFSSYSFEDGSMKEYYDDEANKILIEADAIAITETDYYAMKDEIFYRFKRSEPLNSDHELSLE